MNILIIGSGGREHAFAEKIFQSKRCKKLFVAPGNAGTSKIATNLDLDISDFDRLKKEVLQNQVKMVVVGPEAPLVQGITDYFSNDDQLRDVVVIGPSKEGALLEGSKDRAKEFMVKNKIPTAAYQTFTPGTLEEGKKFLQTLEPPYVLKADGLAGGKGVLILQDLEEAQAELENMLLENKFGKASEKVVIEEFLDGIELSVFVLTDGKNYKILPAAKDYKRIGEGDTGLNTGGMGAVSPVPFADAGFLNKIEEKIIKPTVSGLANEEINYVGFIFLGLIKVNDSPYLIEYNVRMGDPEAEAVLPRIKTDLIELFEAASRQQLDRVDLEIDERAAVTVILASGGYPEDFEKNKPISGLDKVNGSLVFHGGTRLEKETVLTNGGRVLAITSLDTDFRKALEKTYRNIGHIHFEGMQFRKDIGQDL